MTTKRNGKAVPQYLRFVACRSMGHEWHHGKPIGSDDPTGTFKAPFGGSFGMIGFPSTCAQCGTERMRWISRSGETTVRYVHPDGYSQSGEERLTTVEWRRTYVSSVFDEFETPRKKSA